MFGARAPSESLDSRKPSRRPATQPAGREPSSASPLWSRLATRVQPKLTVNQPGDRHEQEADRVADRVVSMPDPGRTASEISSPRANGTGGTIQRLCGECGGELQRQPLEDEEELQRQPLEDEEELQRQPLEDEEELQRQPLEDEEEDEGVLQTKRARGATPEVPSRSASRIDALRGRGEPLPESARDFFEPRFGHDFGDVRVHTDGAATSLNRDLEARAFTYGRDIFFGRGQYQPHHTEGQRLLAHELTHVIQQSPDAPGAAPQPGRGARDANAGRPSRVKSQEAPRSNSRSRPPSQPR